jgi:hypothetical protein
MEYLVHQIVQKHVGTRGESLEHRKELSGWGRVA